MKTVHASFYGHLRYHRMLQKASKMRFKALLRKTYSLTYYGVKARREACRGLYVDILRGFGIGAGKTGCIMQKGGLCMFKAKAMGIELASTDLEVMHNFMDIWKRGDGKIPLGFHYKEVDEYYIERSHIWVSGIKYGVFNCEVKYYTCIGRFMTRLMFKFIEEVLKDCFKDKAKERRKTA